MKNARTNPIEARRVAELVIEHFETSPHESLGVIAFNEAQMRAIWDEVHQLAATKPHLDALVNGEGPDGFFVKNLENVQGDERDVILFSVGYGPDQDGKFSMNFGPLNRAGGERRLNVAVTRARLRVRILASFEPEEIRADRTSAQGPKLLAQYLSYAKNGGAWNGATLFARREGVEESIARVLETRGWKVQRRIGFSELRIDLAVQDPNDPERFLLGIECDGESYVSAQTARDRDRLRPQVLQELGWNLLRVWSPDWIQNQDAQIVRIENALAQAQKNVTTTLPTPISARPIPNYNTQVLQNAPTTALPQGTISPSLPQQHTKYDTVALSPPTVSSTPISAAISAALPVGAVWHEETVLKFQGTSDSFYYSAQYSPSSIESLLVQVVEAEGPIRLTVATRRIVAAWGMNKVGAKLLSIVETIARRAQNRGQLQVRGKFLWPPRTIYPLVRVPRTSATARPVEDIALEEIAQAAYLCVRDCFALSREELVQQTARLLGFKQTGINVRSRIEEAFRVLEHDDRVQLSDDAFTIR